MDSEIRVQRASAYVEKANTSLDEFGVAIVKLMDSTLTRLRRSLARGAQHLAVTMAQAGWFVSPRPQTLGETCAQRWSLASADRSKIGGVERAQTCSNCSARAEHLIRVGEIGRRVVRRNVNGTLRFFGSCFSERTCLANGGIIAKSHEVRPIDRSKWRLRRVCVAREMQPVRCH